MWSHVNTTSYILLIPISIHHNGYINMSIYYLHSAPKFPEYVSVVVKQESIKIFLTNISGTIGKCMQSIAYGSYVILHFSVIIMKH